MSRFLLLVVLVLAALVAWGVYRWFATTPPVVPVSTSAPPADAAKEQVLSDAQLEAKIKDACTYCHAYAQPDTIPRGLWPNELKLAYDFIAESDLEPSRVPPFAQALEYFQALAPVSHAFAPLAATPSPVEFRRRHLDAWLTHHGVAHIQSQPSGDSVSLIVSDMRNAAVYRLSPDASDESAVTLAKGGRPCRAESIDLDGDGRLDLLVADLGVLQASDDRQGRVVWLRQEDDGSYSEHVLLSDVGRVADVRAADFDGDGDLDLVVGEFGWRKTGGLHYLENRTTDYAQPQFHPRLLDSRNGVVHVPIADLNGDSRPDFVALFTQHHEQVVAFINLGEGQFRQEVIFDAENPGYGCTGIELVDIDGDGDLDVLLTNGDTLDFEVHRPYHGVQWLENQGRFPFRRRPLISLPGAMSATTGDLDLDGDLDIIIVSMLPFGIVDPDTGANLLKEWDLASLAWLEQTAPGEFSPHVLESNLCAHANVRCVDIDNDGDLDIVTGYFTLEGVTSRAVFLTPFPGAVTIWENKLR